MFQGTTVIELASVLAGPSVGQFFAELGAEVIKVENIHTGGDVTRSWKIKDEKTDDRSAYFCSINWGKKSIAIDLNAPEGREIIYSLARKADVLIASFKPGDGEKLGVDYKRLSAINNSLIYAQVTGYGSDNPRVGYDAIIQAEAGYVFMNGEPGGASLKMPVALMDILAGHHLKEGILLAMLQRTKTGKGNLVEVSLIEAAVSSLANQATNWLIGGKIPQKQGSAHPNIAPYGDVFKTSEGNELLLAVGNDRQFRDLCEALKIASLSSDLRFSTNPQRVVNRKMLTGLLAESIQHFTSKELLSILHARNVPAGAIQNLEQLFQMPEVHDMVIRSGSLSGIRNFASRHALPTHFLPPPAFGEHSHQILSQSLEMDENTIRNLFVRGVIA